MPGSGRRSRRQRGSVEQLPSGALRVAVYTGFDPVTGKRHYRREIVPAAGRRPTRRPSGVTRRLATQVDERRNPRTSATMAQLLDRYLEALDVGYSTHRMCTRYLELHVRPFIGT